MSGGVDSSVAAVLLKKEGYELIGATMVLACSEKASAKGCCSFGAANDAKKVADQLKIPHYTLNFKDQFKKLVIDDFIKEYKAGRTPNPCIRCNEFMKFDLLARKARELGCDYVATGHYARIMPLTPFSPSPLRGKGTGDGGRFKLLKGKDKNKDQSYVLYMMNQESLAHTLYPLGDLTKPEVRKLAKKFGLSVHDKEESQEICFVEDDDYGRFLKEACPGIVKSGKIVDVLGNVVGKHDGVAFYTLGQRKGLGAHKGEPKYVIKIEPKENLVVIGDKIDTLSDVLLAEKMTYVSGVVPHEPMSVSAKIRYNSVEAEDKFFPLEENKAKVVFEKAQNAITPGQSVVLYKGDEVIGGGIIS